MNTTNTSKQNSLLTLNVLNFKPLNAVLKKLPVLLFLLVSLLMGEKSWGQITEGFESGLPASYSGTVAASAGGADAGSTTASLGSGTWRLGDVQKGTTSHSGSSAQIHSIAGACLSTPVITNGVGTVTFWAAGSAATSGVQLQISTDGGSTYTQVGSTYTQATTFLATNTFYQITAVINNAGTNIRLRWYRTAATIYIDDVTTTSYSASTPYYWGGTTSGSYPGVGTFSSWTGGTPWGTTSSSGATTAWPGTGSYSANFSAATANNVTIPSSIAVVPTIVNINAPTSFNTAAATNGALSAGINLNTNTLTTAPVTTTTLTLSGAISNTAGFINQNGAGTTILNNASNAYSGGTTITSGTLSVAADAHLGSGNITMAGGTLGVTTGFSTSKTFAVNSNSTIDVASGQTLTTTGTFSGTGTLTKANSGTLNVNADNGTTFQNGKYNITGGTLVTGSSGFFGSPASTVADFFTINGGTLDFTGFSSIAAVTGIKVSSNSSNTITNTSGTTTVASVIADAPSNTGTVTFGGAATLALSAASTYTGATTIAASTTVTNGINNALPTTTALTNSGTSYALSSYTQTLGSITGSGGLSLGTGALTVGNSSSTTYTGTISGTGLAANTTFTKTGSGTLTLTPASSNTFTGKLLINNGFLGSAAEAAFGANPGSFTAAQITINGGGITANTGSLSMSSNRGFTLGASGGTFDAQTGNTLTLTSVIAGSGALTITGAGTGKVVFGGAHTYNGATNINSGILSFNTTGSFANTPTITIAAGAGFDVSGTTSGVSLGSGQTLKSSATGSSTTATLTIASSKNLTLSAGGLTFTAYGGGSTAPLTVTGASAGALALNGAPITITTTTALTAGSYTIIAKASSATGVSGTPGTLSVNGSGIAAGTSSYLSVVSGQLILTVANITPTTTTGINLTNTTYGTAQTGQSQTVSAAGITGSISVTAPTGIVVSNDGTTFGSSASLANTGGTLYYKLDKTAVVGDYDNKVISLSGNGGAITASITTNTTGTAANQIAQASLTITGLTGVDKTYDGATSATATGSATLSATQNGDVITLGGTPSYSYSTAAVGNTKTITTLGYTISGTNYTNYILTQPSLSANITAKGLTVTGLIGVNKTYDGSNTATTTGTAALSGVLAGEVSNVTLGGSPTYTFGQSTVGNTISITTSGYSISGSASGNYSISQPTLSANITAKELTITGLSVADHSYDGTSTATLTGTPALSGVITGDVSNVTLGGTYSANFSQSAIGTGLSVTVSGYTIGGSAAGNYSLTQPSGLTGNIISGSGTAQTITFGTLSDVTYGDATFDLSGSASSGLTVSYSSSNTAVATVSSNHVTIVGAGTTTITAIQSGDGTYAAAVSVGQSLTVNTATLTVSASAQSKSYGSTAPTSGTLNTNFTVSGLKNTDAVSGATLGYSGSPAGNLATASVGSYTITASALTLSTGSTANYSIDYTTTGTLTVNAATLTVSASAQSKSYGSTAPTSGTLNTNFTVSGLQNSDAVSGATLGYSGSTAGNLATASVGGYTITPSALTLSTGSTGNYTVNYSTGTLTVNAATLTVSASAQSKSYGSTAPTSGTLNTNFTVSGLQNSDAVSGATLSYTGSPAGNFATASVGSYTITSSALTLSTGLTANYSINYTTTGTLTVNAATLTVSASAQSKNYGITAPTSGTLNTNFTVSGLHNSDAVSGATLSYTGSPAGNLATASVGSYTITASALTLSTGSTANYSINYTTTGTLTVNTATLTVTASAQSKSYGSTAPTSGTLNTNFTVSGLKNSDAVSGATLGYSGSPAGNLATATVASYTITPSALTLSSGSTGNYTINYSTGTLTVNTAALTITGVVVNNKSYDGTTTATFSNTGSYSGLQNSESFSIAGSPVVSFTTSTVGTGKATSISGYTAPSTNYSVTQPTGITANITTSSPPTVTPAPTATVDAAFNVTFTDDAVWRSGISSITVGGSTLSASAYSLLTSGQITFTPSASSLLQSSNTKTIVIVSTGYSNATISQPIGVGTANKLSITNQPTAPVGNGDVLATQPVVNIVDQYGNITSSTAAVTATTTGGTWTVGGGTNPVNGVSGTATFSGLTASSAASVPSATITFTSPSITSAVSNSFSIVAPDFISLVTSASENFSTLGTSSSATIPIGFQASLKRTTNGTPSWVDATYNNTTTTVVGGTSGTNVMATGSSGGIYNFANGVAASASDRAIGFLTSNNYPVSSGGANNVGLSILSKIKNNSGRTISQVNLSWDYVKLRSGTNAATFTFYYSTDGTNWTAATSGDISYSADLNNTTVSWAATNKSFTLSGLSIASSSNLYFRWSYSSGGPNAQALGIDNFAISVPTISTSGSLSALSTIYGTASSTTSFTAIGSNMTAGITASAPSGFELSTTSDFSSNSGSSITVGSAGSISSTLYVRLASTDNAGNYSGNITLSSTGANSYTIATVSSTVNKATPTLTVSNTPVTYTGSAQAATVSSSVAGSVSNILTGGAATQTNAGTYAVTANYTPTDATNYNSLTAASTSNSFVINKAVLIITAGDLAVCYGTPYATVTAAGTYTPGTFVNGENASVIGGSISYTSNYTNTTAGGTSGITITPVTTSLTATNYSFSPVAGNITINATSVGGSVASNQTICNGATPANLVLSGNTGAVTYWEVSTDAAFTSPSTISSTSLTLNGSTIGALTSTKYFRAIVQNTTCSAVNSAYATITVNTAVTAGSIASDQTICSSTAPALFTSATDGTGGGTVTYEWQTNASGSYAIIGSQAANTYQAPTLTTGTSYQRRTKTVENSTTCYSGYTSPVIVTVNNAVTAGTIAADQTICTGNAPSIFTSTLNGTGSGTISYEWQTNASGTYATISSENSGGYQAPTLTSSTSYQRRTVSLSGGTTCYSGYTTPVNITVNPASVGGTIAGSTTVCAGTNNTGLTLSGNTGTVTKWQYSTDNFSSDVHDVANTTSSLSATNISATTYYRAVVTSGVCSSTNSATATITVNQQSANPTAATAGNASICKGASTTLTLSGGGGGTGETIKWYTGSAGGTLVATGNGATVTPASTTTYYGRYEVGSPCSSNSTAQTVTVTVTTNTWTGVTSTDWNTGSNWCSGIAPSLNDNVIIPGGTTYAPTVSGISGTSTVYLNGNTLTVNGAISATTTFSSSLGSSLVLGTGTSGSTITFDAGTDSVTNGLLNLTVSGSVKLTNTLHIYGILDIPVGGAFDLDGKHLILHSNDAYKTASVGKVGGSYGALNNATNVTVQRYHFDRRSWAFLTTPLKAGSTYAGDIKNNWQKYTYITGPVTTGGLDAAGNNNYSLYQWLGNSGWTTVTNTTDDYTLFGNTSNGIAANKSYMIFLRGDRGVTPAQGFASSPVQVAATGILQTGDLDYTLPTLTGTKYALIGNPYAAPIDLNQFAADNTSLYYPNTSGTLTVYYWDTHSSGTGGYTTATYSTNGGWNFAGDNSGTNPHPGYIQSGQAFFVSTNGQSTAHFKESQKDVSFNSNSVFGSKQIGKIKVNMSKGSTYIDGILGLFDNNYTTALITPGEDAGKFWGNEEGLGMLRTSKFLSIEARPEISGDDTMFLYMNKMVVGTNYKFDISGQDLPATVNGYLFDKYLNTQTPLNLTQNNSFSFTIDTAAASKSAMRFMIVFNSKAPLYASEIKVKASVKAKAAVIDWTVSAEKDVDHYTVESSKNGKDFSAINNTQANNKANSAYSYTDNQAANGDNYYRIKAISKDGTVQYSNIAKVTIGDRREGISIYPNPVVGKTMNVQLSNIAAGNYEVVLYNANGQQVMAQTLQHAGGSITTTMNLPANLPSGIYQLKIGKFVETVIVK